jgi:hypothetical protein
MGEGGRDEVGFGIGLDIRGCAGKGGREGKREGGTVRERALPGSTGPWLRRIPA